VAVLVDAALHDCKPQGTPMTYQPNVLLLDQDHVLRRATALLLCNRGAIVSSAATLEEAISLSLQRVYDVALIDLGPGTEGAREVLGRLRREGTMPRRIVLCADEPISSSGADEVSEVLLKPYAFGRLLSTIFAEQSPRPSTRSGIFPRLRLVRSDLEPMERDGAVERSAHVAGGTALEAVLLPGEARGGPGVDVRGAAVGPRGTVVRFQHRGRSGPSGRTLRSPRRVPRGARHPG
jgi:CheY-like chemotaxis protein